MKCDGVRHLLSAYLDGELDRGEQLMVDQHVRRCHCCADDLNSLRQTVALCASLDEVEVPADFRAGLRTRLVALGPPVAVAPVRKAPVVPGWRRNAGRWALPAAAAAAFAVAVGIGPQMASKIAPVNPPSVSQSPVTVPSTAMEVDTNGNGGTNNPTPPAPETNQPPTQSETPPKVGENGTPGLGNSTPTPSAPVNPDNKSITATDPATPVATTTVVSSQVARSATVGVRVPDPSGVVSKVVPGLVAQFGAKVTQGSIQADAATKSYSLMITVTPEKIESLVTALKKLGVSSGGTVETEDVGLKITRAEVTIEDLRTKLTAVTGTDASAQAQRDNLNAQIADKQTELELLKAKVGTASIKLIVEELTFSLNIP